MIELVPLCTAKVDLAPSLSIGVGPAGDRTVGGLSAVTVTGDRLRATLASPAAADWMVRTGSIGVIDVRMTLRTDDEALIYVSYGGRLDMANRANGLNAYVALVFETGDPRYAWLNAIQAVGKGLITVGADGAWIDYEICEIR